MGAMSRPGNVRVARFYARADLSTVHTCERKVMESAAFRSHSWPPPGATVGKGGKAPVLVPGYGETLVEIGPRFALVPIRILAGCFRGATLFSSESFVSPNVKRAEQKKRKAKTTIGAVAQKEKRRKRIKDGYDELPDDDLEDVFRD